MCQGDHMSGRAKATPFWLLAVIITFSGCRGQADPRTLEGMMAFASDAIERDDGEALFRVIDARSQHALISIVEDRRASATLIRENYPEAARDAALAELGDSVQVESAAALFARRCDRACRADIASRIGAPVSQEQDGDELVVHTSRGAVLRVTGGGEDWFGIVWRYDELDQERARANQDRQLVAANAETYARRRRLERAVDEEAVDGAHRPGAMDVDGPAPADRPHGAHE